MACVAEMGALTVASAIRKATPPLASAAHPCNRDSGAVFSSSASFPAAAGGVSISQESWRPGCSGARTIAGSSPGHLSVFRLRSRTQAVGSTESTTKTDEAAAGEAKDNSGEKMENSAGSVAGKENATLPSDSASSHTQVGQTVSPTAAAADTESAATEQQQQPQQQQQQQQMLTLDDVNPVGLGRKSRQFLDDVWRRLLELGQLSRPVPADPEQYEDLIQGPNCEFAIPNAQYTRVLVVGATGKVGRVLVRKLLLRGYAVRALVRNDSPETLELLPRAAEVAVGDLRDAESLKSAVEGCSKVVFCATARSLEAEDLSQVDTQGVVKLARALLNYNHKLAQRRAGRSAKSKAVVIKFNKERYQSGWKLREGRNLPAGSSSSSSALLGEVEASSAGLGMDAEFEITEQGHGLFQGFVVPRGAYVEVKRVVEMPEGLSLGRFEGLVIRVAQGDGKPYSLVLEVPNQEATQLQELQHSNGASSSSSSSQSSGKSRRSGMGSSFEEWEEELEEEYSKGYTNGAAKGSTAAPLTNQYVARFNTRRGPSTVRIPFSAFRPSGLGQPPLDPSQVTSLAIRYEQRRSGTRQTPARPGGGVNGAAANADDPNAFRIAVDFIKAFPGGDETDFILVSCTGAAAPEHARAAVIGAKVAGEAQLRNSGLGYTIVRPGPLIEEPGGRKALVFDQGNRITQGISCADVADVCVKALHDPMARNKSFDICYEYSDGSGLYELVAHLPDKANDYLTPALALLEKNT